MAPLTHKQLRAVLLAALAPVLSTATPPGPFKVVLPYAAKLLPGAHVDTEAMGQTPAAFVGPDREQFGASKLTEQDTLLETSPGVGGAAIWMVLIAVNLPNAKAAVRASEILDDCIDAVEKTLNGYTHPDLMDGAIKLVDAFPFPSPSALLLHVVRVKLTRLIDGAADEDPAEVYLDRADIDVETDPSESDETNPLVQARVDFEHEEP